MEITYHARRTGKSYLQKQIKEKMEINQNIEIGVKYRIQTKNGIVEKYLSYIDKRTNCLYFVENEKDINDSNIGYMLGVRGTVHSTKNVIGVVNNENS